MAARNPRGDDESVISQTPVGGVEPAERAAAPPRTSPLSQGLPGEDQTPDTQPTQATSESRAASLQGSHASPSSSSTGALRSAPYSTTSFSQGPQASTAPTSGEVGSQYHTSPSYGAPSSGISGGTQERVASQAASVTTDSHGGQYAAGDAMERAQGAVSDAMDRAQDQASRVADQARDVGRSLAESQKARAAEGLQNVAQALRQTSQTMQQKDQGAVSSYLHQAADRVEQFSGYLRNNQVGHIVDDVESFARRQPALFLGGAFALGLLAARFLKSNRPSGQRYPPSYRGPSSQRSGQRPSYQRFADTPNHEPRDYATAGFPGGRRNNGDTTKRS